MAPSRTVISGISADTGTLRQTFRDLVDIRFVIFTVQAFPVLRDLPHGGTSMV
jgi:hypothetical protein